MRRQRCRDETRTPRMRATVVGDSPCSTSSTARRRRRSSSVGVPLGLILVLYSRSPKNGAFSHAGLSKWLPRQEAEQDNFIWQVMYAGPSRDLRLLHRLKRGATLGEFTQQ